MKSPSRDLLVLLRDEHTSQNAIEQQVEKLHEMLAKAESAEYFCRAHELAARRRITSHPHRILRAIKCQELKAFCFLINKN